MRDGHHRLRAQKRRIGRAWNRVRSWLKEEKIKLNEVVAKHAKLQNPAGRIHEPTVGSHASYDLTKARAREVGSLTRVEEFGLSSVYVGAERGHVTLSRLFTKMGKKTISSDDILNDNCSSTLAPPTSISLDRLCVEEGEEIKLGTKSATTSIKTGLKKKLMLGSIRGLFASTYLTQNIDIDEVVEILFWSIVLLFRTYKCKVTIEIFHFTKWKCEIEIKFYIFCLIFCKREM